MLIAPQSPIADVAVLVYIVLQEMQEVYHEYGYIHSTP